MSEGTTIVLVTPTPVSVSLTGQPAQALVTAPTPVTTSVLQSPVKAVIQEAPVKVVLSTTGPQGPPGTSGAYTGKGPIHISGTLVIELEEKAVEGKYLNV